MLDHAGFGNFCRRVDSAADHAFGAQIFPQHTPGVETFDAPVGVVAVEAVKIPPWYAIHAPDHGCFVVE